MKSLSKNSNFFEDEILENEINNFDINKPTKNLIIMNSDDPTTTDVTNDFSIKNGNNNFQSKIRFNVLLKKMELNENRNLTTPENRIFLPKLENKFLKINNENKNENKFNDIVYNINDGINYIYDKELKNLRNKIVSAPDKILINQKITFNKKYNYLIPKIYGKK